jgi:hypothetical protein
MFLLPYIGRLLLASFQRENTHTDVIFALVPELVFGTKREEDGL